MEPLFRIQTVLDRQTALETTVHLIDGKHFIKSMIFYLLGLPCWAFLGYLSSGLLGAAIILTISVIMLAVSFFSLPYRTARKSVKTYRQKLNRDYALRQLEFYDDNILWTDLDTTEQRCLPYHVFKPLKETENYFLLLQNNQNLCLVVSKNGFELGTPDSFRAFICEKLHAN